MGRWSLRQSAGDTPLARWLVDYAESRGWTSGRQAAKYLGVNQAAFATWLRGEIEPSLDSQHRIAEATGVPLVAIAELVRRTKEAKQPTAPRSAEPGLTERLERIEQRILTENQVRRILDEYFRRVRDAGDEPDYVEDPADPDPRTDRRRPPVASDDAAFSEAVG